MIYVSSAARPRGMTWKLAAWFVPYIAALGVFSAYASVVMAR